MKEFIRNLDINRFLDDYAVMGPSFEPLSELILNEHPLATAIGNLASPQ